MARDPGVGYKITAVIMDIKGSCGAGHEVGEQIHLSCHDSGGLCGFFYYSLFSDLQTFQFGGQMPWWDGDVITAECPDPENRVTIRLERSKRE